jgi:hypothetical protein
VGKDMKPDNEKQAEILAENMGVIEPIKMTKREYDVLNDPDFEKQLMNDAKAKANGKPAKADKAGDGTHPLARFLDSERDELEPEEFVLDGILCAGITLAAGSVGVGKTTQIVPLVARVAWLCRPDDPLRPILRRRVIYITEDAKQVTRIIASMRASGELDGISKEEVNDWFRIVKSVRMKADEIVNVAGYYKELIHTNHNPATGISFDASPLVVVDTSNSTIDLEDENSNAEVGKTIATMKEKLDCPELIVVHLSKALKRADVRDVSARGANAWEGDVNQVVYLVKADDKNDDDDGRWLEVSGAKHRFVSSVDGIGFRGQFSYIMGKDVLGNDRRETLRHSVPTIFATGEKRQAIEMAKQAEQRAKDSDLRDRIMESIRDTLRDNPYATVSSIKGDVEGNNAAISKAVKDLEKAGLIVRRPPEFFKVKREHFSHKEVIRLPEGRSKYDAASNG